MSHVPNYTLLPWHLQDGMRMYIEEHIRPGDFLLACLCNDLNGAVGHADSINRHRLEDICLFLYNEIPSRSWGSKEKVLAWLASCEVKGE